MKSRTTRHHSSLAFALTLAGLGMALVIVGARAVVSVLRANSETQSSPLSDARVRDLSSSAAPPVGRERTSPSSFGRPQGTATENSDASGTDSESPWSQRTLQIQSSTELGSSSEPESNRSATSEAPKPPGPDPRSPVLPGDETRSQPHAESPGPEDMVRIPAGRFLRGCNQNLEPCLEGPPRGSADLPLRVVWLDEFFIDRTEVTVNAYSTCVRARVCTEPLAPPPVSEATGDDYPVVRVNWYKAAGFCRWVHKRLPTTDEWEKAARGVDGRKYPWGNDARGFVNQIGPVASSATDVSPYGVRDMAGGVFEWTEDEEPTGRPGSRLLRGAPATWIPIWRRYTGSPEQHSDYEGFRCAWSPPKPDEHGRKPMGDEDRVRDAGE